MSPVRSNVEIEGWEAGYYDLLLNVLSLGRYSHFIRQIIENIGIKPGQSMLDLGSSTDRNDCFFGREGGPLRPDFRYRYQ